MTTEPRTIMTIRAWCARHSHDLRITRDEYGVAHPPQSCSGCIEALLAMERTIWAICHTLEQVAREFSLQQRRSTEGSWFQRFGAPHVKIEVAP